MKKILFIVPFPKNMHPSERFRIELYENILREQGYQLRSAFFWDLETAKILYKKGFFFKKAFGMFKGFSRRLLSIFIAYQYDYIFILREASPVGPPVFEWVYAKLLRKKIIYDLDDAIWIPQMTGSNTWIKFAKSFWKIKWLCKWAATVSAGNQYIKEYALQYNKNVQLIPTCVDTFNKHNKLKNQLTEKIVVGWTGSFSSLNHLNDIISIFLELEKKHVFDFLVIADQDPMLPFKKYRFMKWDADTEIEDLLNCNIGIMPLNNDDFAKGKCGFKIIQFLSLGIPVIASPVGVNEQIVDENINGHLCNTKEEWLTALEKLLSNTELRQQMGINGRRKIIDSYSVESNKKNFIQLFQ